MADGFPILDYLRVVPLEPGTLISVITGYAQNLGTPGGRSQWTADAVVAAAENIDQSIATLDAIWVYVCDDAAFTGTTAGTQARVPAHAAVTVAIVTRFPDHAIAALDRFLDAYLPVFDLDPADRDSATIAAFTRVVRAVAAAAPHDSSVTSHVARRLPLARMATEREAHAGVRAGHVYLPPLTDAPLTPDAARSLVGGSPALDVFLARNRHGYPDDVWTVLARNSDETVQAATAANRSLPPSHRDWLAENSASAKVVVELVRTSTDWNEVQRLLTRVPEPWVLHAAVDRLNGPDLTGNRTQTILALHDGRGLLSDARRTRALLAAELDDAAVPADRVNQMWDAYAPDATEMDRSDGWDNRSQAQVCIAVVRDPRITVERKVAAVAGLTGYGPQPAPEVAALAGDEGAEPAVLVALYAVVSRRRDLSVVTTLLTNPAFPVDTLTAIASRRSKVARIAVDALAARARGDADVDSDSGTGPIPAADSSGDQADPLFLSVTGEPIDPRTMTLTTALREMRAGTVHGQTVDVPAGRVITATDVPIDVRRVVAELLVLTMNCDPALADTITADVVVAVSRLKGVRPFNDEVINRFIARQDPALTKVITSQITEAALT